MRKFVKGSYTIEAACLLPVIIVSLQLLLYTGCFLYDSCLLERSVRSVTLKGVNFQGNHKQCEQYMKQEWNHATNKKLLGSKIEKVDIIANGVYVSITCTTKSVWSVSFKKMFSNTYKKTRLCIKGTDVIRTKEILS